MTVRANSRYPYQRTLFQNASASDLRTAFGAQVAIIQPSSPTRYDFFFIARLVKPDIAAVLDQKNIVLGRNGFQKAGRPNAEIARSEKCQKRKRA
jgi:hypothetical protein